ncbi:MAG: DUF4390 domain-containing protein [Granulosicoccaceae bacterium]
MGENENKDDWVRTERHHRWAALSKRGLLLWLLLATASLPLRAEEGRVHFNSLVSYVVDSRVYLSTDVSLQLSGLARSALESGVALEFDIDIQVWRQLSFWPDETLRRYQISHRLSYQELTRSYRLERLESGERASFSNLTDALHALASLRDLVLLPESELKSGRKHYGSMTISLDIDALPSPLRTQAYFSRAWKLQGGEQQWRIR